MPDTEPQDNGAPDVSDRPAALDRYSQVSAVHDALACLLEATQLHELTAVSQDNPEAVGELEELGRALWPVDTVEDEQARDRSPEYHAAEARSDVLAAKLLLSLVDSAEELRSKADLLLFCAQLALTPSGAKGGDDA